MSFEDVFRPLMDFVEMWQRTQPQLGLVLAEVARVTDEGFILTYQSGNHTAESAPARMASFAAGKERGVFFMPEVGDEVVVGFEMGNINQPVILGALWSNIDAAPPGTDGSASNNVRMIRSRAGHEITFDDSAGSEKIKIKTAATPGYEITLEDGPSAKISIKTTGDINSSKIVLDGVAWNHIHPSGSGPTEGPISKVPVV